jgi:hypothetical protein
MKARRTIDTARDVYTHLRRGATDSRQTGNSPYIYGDARQSSQGWVLRCPLSRGRRRSRHSQSASTCRTPAGTGHRGPLTGCSSSSSRPRTTIQGSMGIIHLFLPPSTNALWWSHRDRVHRSKRYKEWQHAAGWARCQLESPSFDSVRAASLRGNCPILCR